MNRRISQNRFIKGLRRAFTITELVIVIAVIAILAAVLIPTFSAVVDSSKKSHDEQYLKQINVAISNYTASNGAPTNYQELMLALAGEGLCDESNPFLLATSLKQEDMYIVWYPNTNVAVLLDGGASSDYIVQFTSSVGLGNAVYIFDKASSGTSTSLGYALCSTGTADGKYIAEAYYDYYVGAGGDISLFLKNFGSKYSSANINNSVTDVAWGNSIIAAMTNQKSGYTYSESIATGLKEQAASYKTINLSISVPSDYKNATEEQQAAVQQEVRSSIATIAQLANASDTAEVFANKEITLGESSTALEGVVVDMSEVQLTPIGNVYRKDYSTSAVTTSSFSVDFCGLTIDNMEVAPNELMAAGAEYQTEKDCTFPGGAYVFTYGLFGTIHAAQNDKVTISNVTITNVNMDLTVQNETISGQSYQIATDMAGVVAGYTQGDVVFENITVNGVTVEGEQGSFSGFDGVAGLLGRAYTNAGTVSTFKMKGCTVANMTIFGQRRAAGFVAYASGVKIEAEDCTLENVDITCERSDGGKELFSGAFGHIANVALTLNGVTFKDVTTTIRYKPDAGTGTAWINIEDDAFHTATNYGLPKTVYVNVDGSPLVLFHVGGEDGCPLPTIDTKGVTIISGSNEYTVSSFVRGEASALTAKA